MLDRFGKQANDPTLNEGGLLGEILQNVATTLNDALRKELTEKQAVATKQLRSSIDSTQAVPIADGVSVSIVMNDYYQRVEEGTTPKQWADEVKRVGFQRKIQDLEEWISAKGIQVRQNKKQSGQSVLDARRSLAYAIASKIAKRGTIKRFGYKGANFIKDVLTPQNIEAIAQHLGEMYGRKIELFVTVE